MKRFGIPKVALLILTVFVFLAGCSKPAKEEPATQPRRVVEVTWSDHSHEKLVYTDKHGKKATYLIRPEFSFQDETVQQRFTELGLTGPLLTEEALLDYAWAAGEALIALEYLPTGFVPLSADHQSNGVWRIFYTKEDWIRPGLRDGCLTLYVADADGHVIFFDDTTG